METSVAHPRTRINVPIAAWVFDDDVWPRLILQWYCHMGAMRMRRAMVGGAEITRLKTKFIHL